VIGISGHSKGSRSIDAMIAFVKSAGGEPRFLNDHTTKNVKKDLAAINGLVLMGNDLDISPERYTHRYAEDDPKRNVHPETKCERACKLGAARADYEEAMLEKAIAMGMPVFGICGGMQRINVMCGGTLHQHVPDLAKCNDHAQNHKGIDPSVAV